MIHSALGVAKSFLGDFEGATDHYHRSRELDPTCVDAYNNLSRARRFTADDGLHLKIERLLASTVPSRANRCILHFAAGKIYDDLERFDDAFPHLEQGNQSKHARFDAHPWRHFVDRTINIFNRYQLGQIRATHRTTPKLVFVVGMPRSGTTLVEQILASHPRVFGAGELPDLSGIFKELPQHASGVAEYPECVVRTNGSAWLGFGDAYLRRVQGMTNQATECFVDKTPRDFLYLGLMEAMFSDVRIVHCRRDPLDNGFSCYFTNFKFGQSFSYDLKNVAQYYGGYHRLMKHWCSVSSLPILEVTYEALVQDQASMTRRLLDFVELSWDEACLTFQKAKRSVPTVSSWQVHQPLYTSSLGRWKNYRQYLQPLIDELAKEGVPTDAADAA